MRSFLGRKIGWLDAFAWVLIIGLVYACTGCSDAHNARHAARHKDHKVQLWSGGKAVREWRSKGHTTQPEGSSMLYFMDKETGLYVKLRGTISIEQITE